MSNLAAYLGFLVIAFATHMLIGYTLGQFLFDRPWIGAIAGLAPDIDFLFPEMLEWPFVHRGITHTLLIGAVATTIVLLKQRKAALAFGVAYLSHLCIDTTTPKGVPHLYPLVETSFYVDLGTTGHSPGPTAAFWVVCLGLLWYYDHLSIPDRLAR